MTASTRSCAGYGRGRVDAVTGHWRHSAQMRTQIPEALRFLGLLP